MRGKQFTSQDFGLLERNSIVLIQDIAQHRAGRGGQLAVSEILPHVEAANFLIKDLEILGEDQLPCLAMTRMGEVLPNGSTDADALRKQAGFVFQLQLSPFQDAVPFTRDYIAERHGQLESKEQELGLT